VIDLDVQAFFDSVDHDLMVKAVAANTDRAWVLLYVRRWLTAPLRRADGAVVARDRGTPQGSAVSPVLANLFMHYAFDTFLVREFPEVEFERYADDAVVHCVTERQARRVLAVLATRMEQVGLRLHPGKTRIVYCKDDNRPGAFEHTSFTFLGYEFCPRSARGRRGEMFTAFTPAISQGADGGQPPGAPMADPHPHRTRPVRPRRADQPDRAGLGELLRPVPPVEAASPPQTHQRLPGAVGSQEVPTAGLVQACQEMVGRPHRPAPRSLRALAVDRHVPMDQVIRAV
jgi:hypothetical protein